MSVLGDPGAVAQNPGPPGTTTYVFRQGLDAYAGTVDTHIRQSDPATPLGAAETLIWDTNDPPPTGADTLALLKEFAQAGGVYDDSAAGEKDKFAVGGCVSALAVAFAHVGDLEKFGA